MSQPLDLSETIAENITNNILTTAGTRLIQSTLPPQVQQRIANRLGPATPTTNVVSEGSDEELQLPPLDFDIPVTYSQAKLLVQHKMIRPSRIAFRKLVFDLGAWVTSDATQQSALGSVVFTIITIVLFILATVTYAVFYAAYMPTVVTKVPIYLNFDYPMGGMTAVQFPEAIVDFTHNILPQHALRPEQHYTVGIDLVVPDAPQNYDFGNFMVSMNLSSAGAKNKEVLLMSAKRPALVAYKSIFLRSLQTLFRSVSLVGDWTRESQVVRVLMVDDFVEREDLPLQKAVVKVHTTAIQIFSAYIYLSAHFQGLRHFMHDWFYTTAALFIIFFMFWYAVIALLLWRMFVSWFENKAAKRKMKKVIRKRINTEGIEEEYESEEEMFSDDDEVRDAEITTRVRVDLGKILKSTSSTAASTLAASAAAANANQNSESVSAIKKRNIYKMDALDLDGVTTGNDQDELPKPRSSSLPRDD